MTDRRTISILLLAVSMCLVWWLEIIISATQKKELHLKNNRPDLYMENLILHQYDETGDLEYRADAASLTHYPLDDSLEIRRLQMLAYKTDSMPLNMQADRAIHKTNGYIHLVGNVRIHQDGSTSNDLLHIESEQLFIDNNRDYLETPGEITLQTGFHKISGVGMQAWIESGKFSIKSAVRGVHEF